MTRYTIIALSLFCLFSTRGFSQSKWAAEFSPGLTFPTEDILGATVNTGFGFDIYLSYNLFPHLAIYGGWGWNEFRADEAIESIHLDLEKYGYSLGLQLLLPLGNSGWSYVLRGSAIYNQMELEDNRGEVYATSGNGFGWQVETGIDFMISTTWSLRPLAGYRTLKNSFQISNWTGEVDLNYYSIGLGLVKRF